MLITFSVAVWSVKAFNLIMPYQSLGYKKDVAMLLGYLAFYYRRRSAVEFYNFCVEAITMKENPKDKGQGMVLEVFLVDRLSTE